MTKAVSTARRLVGAAARVSGLHSAQAVSGGAAGPEELFDESWYRSQSGLGPRTRTELVRHYRDSGIRQGFDPHPLFDTSHYLHQLSDGEACPDPLAHYFSVGVERGLDPHPLFHTTWYLDHYPDVVAAGANPLAHYIEHGGFEGRATCPDFDGEWYLGEYPDVGRAGINPLVHYCMHGEDEGRFPTAFAKHKMLITVNAGVVNIGRSHGLESTGWYGDPSLLEPPITPAVVLDPVALADHKVASFDVWDTLLLRRCHPEEIKLASARFLLLSFHRWLRPELRSITSLYRGRLAAEAQVSFGPDREYRFSEAAVAWIETAMVDTVSRPVLTDAVEAVLNHEIRAETRATYRNQAMDPVLSALAGRTLIFASDFYLPSEFIRRLLLLNGIDCNFSRTYASCEDGKAKRSGRMFATMLDDLGLDRTGAADIVHIGDNIASDVRAASEAGLSAVHHRVERSVDLDEAVADRIADNEQAYDRFVGAALARAEATLPVDPSTGGADELRRLGVRFAPVAVGLALKVIEEAVENGIDRVFFFTREGVFIKQLVDRIIAADPYLVDYPETELLEVSRKATFAASLESLSADQLMRMWTVYSTQSPRALVTSLNLDEEMAQEIFAKQGLDLDEPVEYPWTNDQFMRALADPAMAGHARSAMGAQRTMLGEYASAKGLDAGNPMIVDLGWRGTIQDNLSRAIDLPLRGVYLGLFEFLNDQPANGHKVGWLFDHNDPDDDAWTIDEVAPLEMLFNAVGGSVVGYRRAEATDEHPAQDSDPARHGDDPDRSGDSSASLTTIAATRHTDPAEEAVIAQRVVRFHEGILDALPELVDLVALHAMSSAELRALARKLVLGLIRQPPPAIAEAFFNLSHNETFGTGSFDDMRAEAELERTVAELDRGALYTALDTAARASRWPEGYGTLSQAELNERPGPRALHVPTRIFASSRDISTDGSVGIFAPAPIIGSGGHRTIYNLARGIAATGLEVQLFLDGFGAGIEDVVGQLRGSGVNLHSDWNASSRFDYAIATVAASAGHVERIAAAGRGYLVQDFEAYFNPVSDGYISAESSYTDSFDFLTVGSWLGHVLQTRYGSRAFSSGLGANLDVYRPLDDDQREQAVCFLYQPEKPRRTPQLGIAALEIVKRRCPEVAIYVYGSDADIDLDFEVENLGLIRDLEELNALYNRCKVGLCISMTNPSRIPFELMASGVVPVDVYRYNTLFDYDDDTAALAYQSPASLAKAMIDLLDSESDLERHRRGCAEFIGNRPLGWETEVMVNTVLARISGIAVEPTRSVMSYRAAPIIAESDTSDSTTAFCDWQRRTGSV